MDKYNLKKLNLSYLLIFILIEKSFAAIPYNLKDNYKVDCFLINNIEFVNGDLLGAKKKKQLIIKNTSQCLTKNKIEDIAKTITNYYIEKGYVTSQAYIPEQDLLTEKLIINTIKGKIKQITIEDTHFRLIHHLFPNSQGKYLNLRDLEHGLEQLNRFTTTKYSMDILPSDSYGYSIIKIKKQRNKKIPLEEKLTINSLGTYNTGKLTFTSSTKIDNLLNLGEQWHLLFNTNTNLYQRQSHRAFSVNVNMPYGYWFYQYQLSYNSDSHTFKSKNGEYPYQSKNRSQQFKLNRLVYRDNKQKIVLNSQLEYKKTNIDLAQRRISINSPTFTTLSFGTEYYRYFKQGYFTIRNHAKIGLSLFDTSNNYISSHSPARYFGKLNTNINFQYQFKNNFIYLTSFYSQYTADNLYSAEKIKIDSQNAIRGYKDKKLTANNGFYWRNEINTPLMKTYIGQWRVMLGLDYGVIYSDKYGTRNNSLIGGAAGVLFYYLPLTSQVYISKPIVYSPLLKPDNWLFSWSVSLKF